MSLILGATALLFSYLAVTFYAPMIDTGAGSLLLLMISWSCVGMCACFSLASIVSGIGSLLKDSNVRVRLLAVVGVCLALLSLGLSACIFVGSTHDFLKRNFALKAQPSSNIYVTQYLRSSRPLRKEL